MQLHVLHVLLINLCSIEANYTLVTLISFFSPNTLVVQCMIITLKIVTYTSFNAYIKTTIGYIYIMVRFKS
jgi:hypothetical protein